MTMVTVCVPLTIRRRGGRKMIISPDGVAMPAGARTPADVSVTRGDPALVKALARAFRWKRILEAGAACSVSDIARQEKLNMSYVSRVLRLTLLAPDIVEAILDGRAPGITLQALLEPFPAEWEEQRERHLFRPGPQRPAHPPGRRVHMGSDQRQSRLP